MPKRIPNQISVGNFIQLKRNEFNYTQEYVARKIGVSKTAVSNWENGVSMVDVKYIVPLANIFSIKVDELLFPDFELEKNEFYYYTDLFNQMMIDKLEDKTICSKIIELYIQCKIEVAKLIKEYFLTQDAKMIDKLECINKFGLQILGGSNLIDKENMTRIFKYLKEEDVDFNDFHVGDYIDTYCVTHICKSSGEIYKEKNSIFYDIYYMFNGKKYEEMDEIEVATFHEFIVDRSLLFEKIVCNCSSSLAVKYIKTFSQDYRNEMLHNLYSCKKCNIDNRTKKMLKILLRAGCKYINEKREDLTHLIYEECI